MIEWFFGFHDAWRDPRGWFGHCEAWGYNEDQTWVFLDPQSAGLRVTALHRHDDVLDAIAARYDRCRLILKVKTSRDFVIPPAGFHSCASICGALVGLRALFPSGLERKLLATGAEVAHGKAKGRSERQGGAGTRAPDFGN